MDFSISGLFSAFIFGVIGMYLFGQARSRGDIRLAFVGVGLMVYPYFTSGPFLDWGVGFALCGLAYYIW